MSEISDLTELVRTMMEERKRHDQELAEEHRQREVQLAEERRQREEQMQLIMRLVEETAHCEESGNRGREQTLNRDAGPMVRITRLMDKDDVKAYLTTFERLMSAHEIEREQWSFELAPCLTGRAQQAYAALEAEVAKDYERLKAEILRRYDINEETYRQQFRAASRKPEEPYCELVIKMQDLQKKWMRDCTSLEEVFEMLVMEQLINTMPSDLRVWIRERKPKSTLEAGELADQYMQARDSVRSEGGKQDKRPTERRRCHE